MKKQPFHWIRFKQERSKQQKALKICVNLCNLWIMECADGVRMVQDAREAGVYET